MSSKRCPAAFSQSSLSVLESLPEGDSQLSFQSNQRFSPKSSSKILSIPLNNRRKHSKKPKRRPPPASPLVVATTRRDEKTASQRVARNSHRENTISESCSDDVDDSDTDPPPTQRRSADTRKRTQTVQNGFSSSSDEDDDAGKSMPTLPERSTAIDSARSTLLSLDDDSDEEMEIPYAQAFDKKRHEKRPVEPLRAGDVVSYYHPAFVAGNPMGFRIAQVVRIQAGEIPVVLSNMECLSADCYVRRLREYKKGKLVPHEGLSRAIENFNYVVGDELQEDKHFFEDQLSKMRRVLQEGRNAVQQVPPQSEDEASSSDSSSESDASQTQKRKSSSNSQKYANETMPSKTNALHSQDSDDSSSGGAHRRGSSSLLISKRKIKAGTQKQKKSDFSSDSDSSVETAAQQSMRSRASSSAKQSIQKQTTTRSRRILINSTSKSSGSATGALVDSDDSSNKLPRVPSKRAVTKKKKSTASFQASSVMQSGKSHLRKDRELDDSDDDSDAIPASVLSSRTKASTSSRGANRGRDDSDGILSKGITVRKKDKRAIGSVSTLVSVSSAASRTKSGRPNKENDLNGSSSNASRKKTKSVDPRKATSSWDAKTKKKKRQLVAQDFVDDDKRHIDMNDAVSLKAEQRKEFDRLVSSSTNLQKKRKRSKPRLDSSSSPPDDRAAATPLEDTLNELANKAPRQKDAPASPPIQRKRKPASESSQANSLIRHQEETLQRTCDRRNSSFSRSEQRQEWHNNNHYHQHRPSHQSSSQISYMGCSQDSIASSSQGGWSQHQQPSRRQHYPPYHQQQQSRKSSLELDFQAVRPDTARF